MRIGAADLDANTVGDLHRYGLRIGGVPRLAQPPFKLHVVLLFQPFRLILVVFRDFETTT